MKPRQDIQELIPETHRKLIQAVPRGFGQSAIIAGLLLGAFFGAALTYLVPAWLAGTVVIVLAAAHWIYKWRSDKFFDRRMAELEAHGLEWETEEERELPQFVVSQKAKNS